MDASVITGLAALLGSATGATAAITTAWINEHSKTVRERAHLETHKRETLYGDFITEASRLAADAYGHSLDNPEKLVKLFATMARIRLMASDAVVEAAEACCTSILELYAKPNHSVGEIYDIARSHEWDIFKHFSDVCRGELKKFTMRGIP